MTGAPALGHRTASKAISRSASVHRRCFVVLVAPRIAGPSLVRPGQEVAEAVDDAAAMAAVGWPPFSGAIVVKGAAADAQQLGGLVDGEKRVVDIVRHGVLPHMLVRQCAAFPSCAERMESAPSRNRAAYLRKSR